MPVYDGFERSSAHGRDVRLYTFIRAGREWNYNGGDRDLFFNGQVYTYAAITDDGIKQKSDVQADDFTLTVPSSNPVVVMFNGTPPSESIGVVMRQIQYGDTEAPIMWRGYVSSVKYRDELTSTIVCNTQIPTLSRKGLRLCYERSCPHALYDEDCGVDKTQWSEWATITGLLGNGFDFQLAGDTGRWEGRFTNGFVEFQPTPDYTERRAIQWHGGNSIILLNLTDGMYVGQGVLLYPGCARTPQNCKLFNNIPNYGGFPMMPGRSPFDGNPVF